jgi:hypothetical protein
MADENVSMMMTLTDYQLSEAEAKQLLAVRDGPRLTYRANVRKAC